MFGSALMTGTACPILVLLAAWESSRLRVTFQRLHLCSSNRLGHFHPAPLWNVRVAEKPPQAWFTPDHVAGDVDVCKSDFDVFLYVLYLCDL
jgi:hypothetical protein